MKPGENPAYSTAIAFDFCALSETRATVMRGLKNVSKVKVSMTKAMQDEMPATNEGFIALTETCTAVHQIC